MRGGCAADGARREEVQMSEEEIREALKRRALGFESDEVVEEYGFSEGEAVLVKR